MNLTQDAGSSSHSASRPKEYLDHAFCVLGYRTSSIVSSEETGMYLRMLGFAYLFNPDGANIDFNCS